MTTLVNIASLPRSGSTMFDLILGNAKDAFSCGEVYAWFRPYRKHHFKIDCSCNMIPCPIWEKVKMVPESQFHTTLSRDLGVNFIIDSSKDLCWFLDVQVWAAENNINVKNLLLWKNPVDLAYSYWKRGKDLNFWHNSFKRYYKRIFQMGIPFFAVNFNDLVSNPQHKVAEVCASIDMPYFKGKERYWEKEHHYLFGSAGVRRQVEAGCSSIIKIDENYNDSFKVHIETIRKQVESDADLQQILEVLKKFDVSTFSESVDIANPTLPKKPYPLWYYGKKVKGIIRHYFPNNFNLSAFENAETVPKAKS